MWWITIGMALLMFLGLVASIVYVDSHQFSRNQKVLPIQPRDTLASRTLVVFFSRSGNTALMARQIALLKKAQLLPIESDRNKIGFKGWIEALMDARKTEAVVSPSIVDLSPYDTVFIGSPIWLYSPAPAIFEFARNNDFSGKKVILFNSMNSKFEQGYIDDFANLIAQNGGEFIEHLYVIRGRMTRQMDTEEFLEAVKQEVEHIP